MANTFTSVFILFAIAAILIGVGCGIGANFMRQEAVDKGQAVWVVDKQGHVTFAWLPVPQSEPEVAPDAR